MPASAARPDSTDEKNARHAGSPTRAAGMKTRRRKPDRLPPLPDRDAVRLEAAARLEEIAAHVWPDDVNVRRSGRSIRYGTKGARVIHVEECRIRPARKERVLRAVRAQHNRHARARSRNLRQERVFCQDTPIQ